MVLMFWIYIPPGCLQGFQLFQTLVSNLPMFDTFPRLSLMFLFLEGIFPPNYCCTLILVP